MIWSRGFRPFFLLAAAQGILAVGYWLGVLRGLLPAPAQNGFQPIQWHAHEMLFGFAAAAVAGFLLTSVPVWTGRPAVAGARLAAFSALWLSARVAIAAGPLLPSPWIAAVLDVAFPAALAVAIGRSIYGSRSRRNYAFPLLLGALAAASASHHLEAIGVWRGAGGTGMRLGVGIVMLLVAVLGGRLIPLFTGAALKRAGISGEVRHRAWADAAAAPAVGAFVVADTAAPDSIPAALLALMAAGVLTVRASGWQLRRAWGDPLLWSMHLAYLWLPAGLAALGLSALFGGVPRSVALHGLTVGAIGGMILAIMSRVALGHTGRPFHAPRGMSTAYALVFSTALARTAGLAAVPSRTAALLIVSGILWILAYGIFLWVYTPFLLRPRIDGKPG